MRVGQRVIAWGVARATRGREGGRLVWVDREGQVVDLGTYDPDDLRTLAWAWRVAYRGTTSKDDRGRLARARDGVARLGREVARLR